MKNKLLLLSLFLLINVVSVSLQAQQLAFPGAEGFGRYATGARAVANPQIYHVTNLDDSGPGSLRDAISQPGRYIVFDVCGEIKLKSRLVFSGNSYIAGQTAPGDGIIIHGNGVSFSGASNLIVRYLRIYMGKDKGSSGKDAAGIANGQNMIFDHLSVAWGLDENFSINWDGKGTEPGDITIQNSIMGQGIMSHSAGGLIQTNNGVSIIGCLYIDNKTRNPKVKGLNQFINNVVYNWGGGNGYILGDTEASSWAWLEGNYFIAGPNSSSPFTRATPTFQLYHNNDFVDTNKDGVLDGRATTNSDYGNAGFVNERSAFTGIPKVHPEISGGILSPQEALDKVVASVGASLPARTAVDQFMIDELLSYGKKGKLIVHERENEIYNYIGVISKGPKAPDTDNDGIPDWWEDANGLNKNDASDALQLGANGYPNIENYFNSIDKPTAAYVRCASDLKMTGRTKTSINLSWKNNATESDQIVLEQSIDGGTTFTTCATLQADATSYNATNLLVDQTYHFRLITQKAGLDASTPSEILKTATEGEPQIPHQSHTPSPAVNEVSRFYTSVDFSWENETGPWAGDVSYSLFFGADAASLTEVANNLTTTSFTFEGEMEMNKTYYWRVDATNTLGTTPGSVWSFKTGTYSFTTTCVDLGRDFDGNSSSNAQTGTLITTDSKYTINAGSIDEMIFSASNSKMMNTTSKNGVYETSGNYTFMYISSDDYYIQGTLTEKSSEKNIASVKVNGTSADLDSGCGIIILFSDGLSFDAQSIIGYEEAELPPVRSGGEGVVIPASIGTKSFRIYRKVTISTAGEDLYQIGGSLNPMTLTGGGSPRIAYLAATTELLSNDDGNSKSPDNTIKSATINGKKAIVDNEAKTITCQFVKGTIPGEWPVTFLLNSSLASADFESGNPHNFANGPLSIEVTAQDGSKAVYTVNAIVSDKIAVGMLTATGAAASYDGLLLSAFADYDVQFLDASATKPADMEAYYRNYDLIVIHASVAGNNPIGVATSDLAGIKPILNLKAFTYSKDRWNWSTPNNTEIGRMHSNVDVTLQNHPIFTNVAFDGDKLELLAQPSTVINAFQYVSAPFTGTSWTVPMETANHTLATIDGDDAKVHIHELNLDNSAKYLLIGLSNEGDSYTLFNTNAVNLLKNAAAYLLNPNVYYDYASKLPVGIKNSAATARIGYLNGFINNPEQETVTIYNSVGMPLLTSSESHISVQHLHAGLYIAKTKTTTIKFMRR